MALELITRIGPGYITTPTFKTHVFWAGEQHIEIANENDGKGPLTEIALIRGADANDLVMAAMWADAVHQRGGRAILLLPYLPGARQDRGIPFGAQVYANVINAIGADQVICFDPHSPVMPGLINNLTIVDSARLVRDAVVGRADRDTRAQRYTGIIAPDKGAHDRAAGVAAACHLPLYQAGKVRAADRTLSDFTVEDLPADGRYLVVDDICDGGLTFRGLAEATGLPREQLGLYVSHGVFTSIAPRLNESYGTVHTTDSFPSLTDIGAHVIHLAPYLATAIQGA